ncbi:MAG: 5-formyltetrahydrofolate cyclo-ligase [Bacteroidales bacterium]|nr:5-formyltetrahydrofolate cyclo-ligase [Bacteroidales bacterium]
MEAIDIQKKKIRKFIREEKLKLPEDERFKRSVDILQQLENHPRFQQSELILIFWSMKDEVHTHSFLEKWHRKKKLLLPCVEGQHLKLRLYQGLESMKAGDFFGIPEPTGPEFLNYHEIELGIIPGVAFDKQQNRMGRGKAYYDQLLPGLSAYLIGICFSFQYLDKVPTDIHDVKMHEIVCG